MAEETQKSGNSGDLYRRLRSSSRNEVIREEMIRLGFWRPEQGEGKLTDEWLKERSQLGKELSQLLREQKIHESRDQLLLRIRRRRMADSRERQKETRERREREREEKAKRWEELSQHDVIHLGEGVSGGLGGKKINAERIAELGLPQIPVVTYLAQVMGISVGELKFLSYHRKVARKIHYRRFYMPKKTGGQRLISAPMPRLKRAQHWILENLLSKIPLHDCAHGFVNERSIVTNAAPHVGRDLVINMDLQDFFPTITYPRVKGVFRSFGYSEQISTILALICTEPETEEVEIDGETFHVATSERHLPQGAPTSPALTNVLCYRFDRRIIGMADKLGFTYTRYADDLTFSAKGSDAAGFRKLLWRAKAIIQDEGFRMHPDKLRIMRRGERQEVTGLVVNDSVGIDRRMMRKFKALVFQIEKDGIDGKVWNGKRGKHLLASMKGYADFINMVYPEKSAKLQERVRTILAVHNFKPEIIHPKGGAKAAADRKPKSWWRRLLAKFFGG